MIAEIVKEVFKVPKVIAKIYDFENNTRRANCRKEDFYE